VEENTKEPGMENTKEEAEEAEEANEAEKIDNIYI
jgi:hypothetical protein